MAVLHCDERDGHHAAGRLRSAEAGCAAQKIVGPQEVNMIGFVLSGGANRGALQVGALQALTAHHIKANLVVGTSAGALNGVYYAYDPTPAGLERLAQLWIDTKKDDIFPGNRLTMAWRV